ncbi:MAG: response regulator [Candidatus Riflebacteria bacterium]|nr:response regulator [Candidatus Riflebacteria bacterium]
MTSFLVSQLDYIFFLYGLAFLLLAVAAYALNRLPEVPVRWGFLCLFGITHGLNEWLDMLVLGLGDSESFMRVRIALLGISFLFLLEFVRQFIVVQRGRVLSVTTHLFFVLPAVSGAFWGLPELGTTIRFWLGFFSSIAAAWVCLDARRYGRFGSRSLEIMAGSLCAYGVAAGLISLPSTLFPGNILNTVIFLRIVGIPIQVFRCLCACSMAFFLWRQFQKRRFRLQSDFVAVLETRFERRLLITIGIGLFGGWLLTNNIGRYQEKTDYEMLARLTKLGSEIIHPEWVEPTDGTFTDSQSSRSTEMQSHLAGIIRAGQGLKWLYILQKKEGRWIINCGFGAETSPAFPPPGTIYLQPPPELDKAFETSSPCVTSPYRDEYGTFISGFAPIRHNSSGRPLGIFGIDYDVDVWNRNIARVRLLPILFALLVTLLLIAIMIAQQASLASGHELAAAEIARATAEETVQTKSLFLANMSHEIRTPMNAVIGFTDLLSRTKLDPKQRDYVNTVIKSARNLLMLLDDILELSKLEAGKIVIDEYSFDLAEIVEDVRRLFSVRAEEKKLFLKTDIDPNGMYRFIGDGERIRQILQNLVTNAIKFTESGGVTVRVFSKAVSANRAHVRLEVEDSGIGIPRTKVSKLFQKFTQADPSTTRKFGGTGLGLAISKRLIEMMGGSIRIRPALIQGSVFLIDLLLTFEDAVQGVIPLPSKSDNTVSPVVSGSKPLTPDEAAVLDLIVDYCEPPVRDRHADAPDVDGIFLAQKLKVLLAEDDSVNGLLVKGFLEKMGITVTLVTDGRRALDAAATESFDLVFLDCHMPVLDGFETARQLRSMPNFVKTPIIALTAMAGPDNRRQCLDAGMNDHLAKPFFLDELRRCIAVQIKLEKQT